MANADLTAERLRELFEYNPDTGVFTWRKKQAIRVEIGDVAGTINATGYRLLRINNKSIKAHRAAWLYCFGVMPKKQIDHIDGNKLNNAISNLREASASENQQNQKKARKDSKTGILGVSFHKRTGAWYARIRVNGRLIHVGSFNNSADAEFAYLEAKRSLHPFSTI